VVKHIAFEFPLMTVRNPQDLVQSAELAVESTQAAKAARLQLEKKRGQADGESFDCEEAGYVAIVGEEALSQGSFSWHHENDQTELPEAEKRRAVPPNPCSERE
jgi:hypothetical protein